MRKPILSMRILKLSIRNGANYPKCGTTIEESN